MSELTPLPALPTPCNSITRPKTFVADANATFGALPGLVAAWNANVGAFNALAADMALAEETVVQATSQAIAAASASAASAHFKGDWSGLVGPLDMPATVGHVSAVWMLLGNVASVADHQPGISPMWMRVTGAPVTLTGPVAGIDTLVVGIPVAFLISNFDANTTYTVTTTNGTVARFGDQITYTPSTAGVGGFIINARAVDGYAVVAQPVGQVAFTTPGTYTWVCPPNVHRVAGVTIGAGGGRGGYSSGSSGGGALGYKNSVTVVPGTAYTVVVGAPGSAGSPGGNSTFATFIGAEGGKEPNTSLAYSNPLFGSSGGRGVRGASASWFGGGGGAGGYSGDGGYASSDSATFAGSGGGGGAGGGFSLTSGCSGAGGGVGIFGQGASGLGGSPSGREGGGGGSGGGSGGAGTNSTTPPPAAGGLYGGGAPSCWHDVTTTSGLTAGGGAVRLIWGVGRAFPSTNAGDM